MAFFTLQVSEILRHEDYRENSRQGFPNDIALLYLSTPIDLSDKYVYAVELASAGEKFIGNECWITGWGKTSPLGRIPNILQVGTIENVNPTHPLITWSSVSVMLNDRDPYARLRFISLMIKIINHDRHY